MSGYETTPKQEQAIREWLQEAITPLIEQVLVKKLGQAMSFAAGELVQPKTDFVGLTEEQIFDLAEPFGAFEYGDAQGHKRREFARAIEAKLREKNT